MRTVIPESGSRGCDTVATIGAVDAANLYADGFRFVGRYVTSLTDVEIGHILASGLALTLFTYANSFDPSDEIAALKRLGIPHGVVVWLDVEGVHDDPVTLQARINTWARALKQTGYVPGIYAGAAMLLTSAELYNLAVVRYMKSASQVLDRNFAIVEPKCGWCCVQCTVNVMRAGIEVDVDFAFADYTGRTVAMVCA